jgi:hypothetical protein
MMRFTASTLGRSLGTRVAVVAFAIGTVVFGLQSPSMADDGYFTWCSSSDISCQTGVEVSGPTGEDNCTTDPNFNTRICVNYTGDIVFVRDGDADGNSAMGMVRASSGVAERWCRNAHGNGTWAKCNFDWSESAAKDVYGGVRISSSEAQVTYLWSFING